MTVNAVWLKVCLMLSPLLAVGPASHPPLAQFITPVQHGRVQMKRDTDGSIRHGPRHTMQTSNWAGYVQPNFETGLSYTAASAIWNVPSVRYAPAPPVCHPRLAQGQVRTVCIAQPVPVEYSSSWVGVGGYCEDAACSEGDNTLIQIGTEQDVAADGSTQYYAWYELLPDYPVLIGPTAPNCTQLSCAYPVQPGDEIRAGVACEANCTPGAAQTWLVYMADTTRGWSWYAFVRYASPLLSAVWI